MRLSIGRIGPLKGRLSLVLRTSGKWFVLPKWRPHSYISMSGDTSTLVGVSYDFFSLCFFLTQLSTRLFVDPRHSNHDKFVLRHHVSLECPELGIWCGVMSIRRWKNTTWICGAESHWHRSWRHRTWWRHRCWHVVWFGYSHLTRELIWTDNWQS
jgi:hypothetical protein